MSTIAQRLSKAYRRESSAALWCERLASFALPYLVIVVIGHRFDWLGTVPTLWLLTIGIGMLLLAIALAIRGIVDLWTSGAKGGLRVARGLILAGLLLIPFVVSAFRAFALPPIADISTDLDDPPQFEIALQGRDPSMNRLDDLSELVAEDQLRAYPRVTARRYPLGAGRVFTAAATLVKARGWQVLTAAAARGDAPVDQEGSGLLAERDRDDKGLPLRVPLPKFRPDRSPSRSWRDFTPTPVSPTGRDDGPNDGTVPGGLIEDERYIETVAETPIFGFESDVVIRIVEEDTGTLVDMRSVSRWGPHDLGSNAALIEAFIADLDTALQGLSQTTE